MNGFDPIQVSYKGKTGSIPPEQFMALGARIENVLPYLAYSNLVMAVIDGKPEEFKGFAVSQGYAILLDAAGIKYEMRELVSRISNATDLQEVIQSLDSFYSQLTPPQEAEPKKPKAAKKKKSRSK